MKSVADASVSRSMGLGTGGIRRGLAEPSLELDADCAVAGLAARKITITVTEARVTARERSCDIRDYVDHKADDCRHEEKRKNRMQQGDAAYPHRGDGDVGGLKAHGYRERVIHEIPE